MEVPGKAEHKRNPANDETMEIDHAFHPSESQQTEDGREAVIPQFQAMLNSGDTDPHMVRHEQGEIQGHQSLQADEGTNETDGWVDTCLTEVSRADESSWDDATHADCRAMADVDLADKPEMGMRSLSSEEATSEIPADMTRCRATRYDIASSSSLVPLDLPTTSNSMAKQNNCQSFCFPDLIAPLERKQPMITTEPGQFSCTSSESRDFVQRCACVENEDCPKRDARIFTELVADVGGCLCSRSDLRDRLPRGWPDVFYPLPDLIESQHRYEAQKPSTPEMTLRKTILVTGGAGYVGSHSVIELVEAGYDIVVVDNLVNASLESIRRVENIVGRKITTYSVDLLNKADLEEVFRKHTVHAVIHFAGLKAVGESCELPLLYYKNNVGGTTNLLEVMEAHKVYNLVFSSSATVYGPPQFLPLTEQHPVGGCTSPYAKTKHMVEEMLCDLAASCSKWNFIILRYFNPVGAHKSGIIGEDPTGVPNNLMPFIGQVAVGRRAALKVYGSDYDTADGTGVRDYIHVVDLAKGHVAAIRKLNEQCRLKVYNLGTGHGCSVLDMVKAFEKASGVKIPFELAPRRPGDVPAMYSDPSLAAKELGWVAEKDLDEMCADLWRWQSNNPQGYGV